MLELQGVHTNCRYQLDIGKNNIKKFTRITLSSDGQSKNYSFEPEYDLILYVFSPINKFHQPYKEYRVQYGYMYQTVYLSGKEVGFPVFREVPTEANEYRVNVWKINANSDWEELQAVKVSINYYAYSSVENYDPKEFMVSAMNVIDNYKLKITKKYERDIGIQDNVLEMMSEVLKGMNE